MLISKEKLKQLHEVYKAHFKGKNWGFWNIEKAPDLGVGFQLLQFENDKGEFADIIKFDQKVHLEGKRFSGKSYVLSKAMPDHNTAGYFYYEPPEITKRTCDECGGLYPVNETGRWYSTNYCIECANKREEKIFNKFQEMKLQRGDNSKNREYWIHWAHNHGGGNNMTREKLVQIWEQA